MVSSRCFLKGLRVLRGWGYRGNGVHKSLVSPLYTRTLGLPPHHVQGSLDVTQTVQPTWIMCWEWCWAHVDSGGLGCQGWRGQWGSWSPHGERLGLEAEGPGPFSTSTTACPAGSGSYIGVPHKTLKKRLKKQNKTKSRF